MTPLVCDLDGTLCTTDTLWEQLIVFLHRKPLHVLKIVWWAMSGRTVLKEQLARAVTLDVSTLPYNSDVVAYLQQQKVAGRSIVLATAAHHTVAHAVAAHLQLFTAVYGSDLETNLKGDTKRDLLLELYGEGGYDYIGDSAADVPVWVAARQSLLVRPPRLLESRTRQIATVEQVLPRRVTTVSAAMQALRPHQWVKNILVFVPVLASHTLSSALLMQAALAFVFLCLSASGVYMINDLCDLQADRSHPRKKQRPLAAGHLPLAAGVQLSVFCIVAAVLLSAALLNVAVTVLLLFYLFSTFLYSLLIKRIAMLDVLLLAGLYTLRIFIGAAATGTPISSWLMAFSGFFFLGLALLKRFSEVGQEESEHWGRGYRPSDLPLLSQMGTGSSLLSVLVLALYIDSSNVSLLYRVPQLLWFVLPLMLYWLGHMWLTAHRGSMHDDPLVFAVRDATSYVVGALALGILLLSV